MITFLDTILDTIYHRSGAEPSEPPSRLCP